MPVPSVALAFMRVVAMDAHSIGRRASRCKRRFRVCFPVWMILNAGDTQAIGGKIANLANSFHDPAHTIRVPSFSAALRLMIPSSPALYRIGLRARSRLLQRTRPRFIRTSVWLRVAHGIGAGNRCDRRKRWDRALTCVALEKIDATTDDQNSWALVGLSESTRLSGSGRNACEYRFRANTGWRLCAKRERCPAYAMHHSVDIKILRSGFRLLCALRTGW